MKMLLPGKRAQIPKCTAAETVKVLVFSENWVVNFSGLLVTTESCVEIKTSTDNRSGIYFVKKYLNL